MVWSIRIVGIIFIIFGIFAAVKLDPVMLFNYYIHLAEITRVSKWFWIFSWFISLFSFCIIPIIAGLITFRLAKKFKN
ncbi:MAG: hypothetical protein A3J63_00935 [Candidatus Moranbacteria bacterium RIFCSPHIGHO2_02_FULL_40_12b]|nr:MAG: hypothetical protein A3J63_00935 [Candidatus Moranbacteria bacterium RIFCSPHIGHO2_02_FULL_40_12b]OGI23792.1 MAG: hypothetical protein A3E91_00945 [Candidatus Moranbacteria bacterium RIFCSPHIGHO2_12_FULL_40_10]